MKRAAVVIGLLLIIGLVITLSIKYSPQNTKWKIERVDFKVEKQGFKIARAELKIEYKTNAVLSKFTRDELVLTLFINDTNNKPVPRINEADLFAYLEYQDGGDKKQIFGNPSIIQFNNTGKKVAASIVMDYSSSMFGLYIDKRTNEVFSHNTNVVPDMESGAVSFINNFQQGDQGEIIKFGSDIDVSKEFSSNTNELIKTVRMNSYPRGQTSLYTALNNGLLRLAGIDNINHTKALIVFADGDDNLSRLSLDNIISIANEKYIPIFTIGLKTASFNGSNLYNLAEQTGGFCYLTTNPKELQDLYSRINSNIRNSYLIKVKWKASQLPNSGTNVDFVIRIGSKDRAIAQFKKGNIILP